MCNKPYYFPRGDAILCFQLVKFCLHLVSTAGASEAVFDHWSNGKRLMPRLLAFSPSHSTILASVILRWIFWKSCVRQTILILVVWRTCIFMSKIVDCKRNGILSFCIFRDVLLTEMLAVPTQEQQFCIFSKNPMFTKSCFFLDFQKWRHPYRNINTFNVSSVGFGCRWVLFWSSGMLPRCRSCTCCCWDDSVRNVWRVVVEVSFRALRVCVQNHMFL